MTADKITLPHATCVGCGKNIDLSFARYNQPRDRTNGLIGPHNRAVCPILTGSIG